MNQLTKEIRERLFDLQDLGYKAFQCKLTPTVNPERVIGVRSPALKSLAAEFSRREGIEAFLEALPHDYYDEDNLHGLIINTFKDYGSTVEALEKFLPHVDNWATCDILSPKAFKKRPPELIPQIRLWLASEQTYTIRFGVEMLMSFYLDEGFMPEYPGWVAELRSEEYYVNMMLAWYFATALAKQWDGALPFIQDRRLDRWTHNKAIQKAVESRRITEPQKQYLKTLKY